MFDLEKLAKAVNVAMVEKNINVLKMVELTKLSTTTICNVRKARKCHESSVLLVCKILGLNFNNFIK